MNDPTGTKWISADIHHYMRTNETFELPLFTSNFIITCNDLDYGLTLDNMNSNPDYISLVETPGTKLSIIF